MSPAVADCPLGHRCESCGRDGEGLAVAEVATAAGAVCVTLCPGCRRGVDAGCELPLAVGTAGRLAAQHLEHLVAAGRPVVWSASGADA